VTNQPATGAAAPTDPPARTITTPVVSIGAAPPKVLFSGLAPGYVGLYQMDVEIPPQSTKGTAVTVLISIGNVMSNTVTMAVN
jgi:minor extracellular serine protease Vpr